MILFKEDWDKYPEAIWDLNTRNTSFLDYSILLRDMGVENHLWPLQLHDPMLVGVDPHDPNISPEMAIRVAIECKKNFFYFIREVARDPAGSPEDPIYFKANRGVMALYWFFFNSILVILIMIRQTGKSFGIDWLHIYLSNIRLTKTEISHITKDEKLRGRELDRLKGMELALPPYLKQRSSRDPGNTEVMRISSLGNYIKFYLPNKSPKLADIIGRGMTTPVVVADEWAYLFNNFITIPVMLSASLAAREISKRKNEPYGTVFATTSGKRDTPEGRYAYKVMSDAAVMTEKFYDCLNIEPLRKAVISASPGKNLHVNCTYNHRQLGYTDEWLSERLRESMNEDPVQIRADFLNEWPSGSATSPFDQDTAEDIRNSEQVDYHTSIEGKDAYSVRWYYKESEIQQKMQSAHVLAVDPSQAVGRDSIGIVLRNAETGEVAMACDINEGNLMYVAEWLCDFLIKWLSVTAVIERKDQGPMIIDYLLHYLVAAGINPFRRLYNQVVQFADEFPERFSEINTSMLPSDEVLTKYKKLFGWNTSGGNGITSRRELYGSTLRSAARYTRHTVRDRKLILQVLGLEIRGGRVDHGDGEHDDLVIGWMLSYWLLTIGRNLDYYGINPAKILVANTVYRQASSEVSYYEQKRSEEAKTMVEHLSREIEKEPDDYVVKYLEFKLEKYIRDLSEQDRKHIAADELIRNLRESRSRRASERMSEPSHSGGYSGYQDNGPMYMF